jgi:serine/threonine protein phosphatase PrpC
MQINYSTKSIKGKMSIDENKAYVNRSKGIFTLVDGMGGRGFGDEAAELVSNTIKNFLEHALEDSEATMIVSKRPGYLPESNFLINAVNSANIELYNRAASSDRLNKMGATLGAALISQRYMSFISIGDVDFFLYREGKLKKLTESQTLANYLGSNRFEQHIPLKILGIEKDIILDARDEKLKANDLVIMASSSFSNRVSIEEVENTLKSHSIDDLDFLNSELTKLAISNRSIENLSLLLISI